MARICACCFCWALALLRLLSQKSRECSYTSRHVWTRPSHRADHLRHCGGRQSTPHYSQRLQDEIDDDIVKKLAPFLKQSGFKDDTVVFLPISCLTGDNVKERKNTPDWFSGKPLLELLDSLEIAKREPTLPVRNPMLDGYREKRSTSPARSSYETVKHIIVVGYFSKGHYAT